MAWERLGLGCLARAQRRVSCEDGCVPRLGVSFTPRVRCWDCDHFLPSPDMRPVQGFVFFKIETFNFDSQYRVVSSQNPLHSPTAPLPSSPFPVLACRVRPAATVPTRKPHDHQKPRAPFRCAPAARPHAPRRERLRGLAAADGDHRGLLGTAAQLDAAEAGKLLAAALLVLRRLRRSLAAGRPASPSRSAGYRALRVRAQSARARTPRTALGRFALRWSPRAATSGHRQTGGTAPSPAPRPSRYRPSSRGPAAPRSGRPCRAAGWSPPRLPPCVERALDKTSAS